MDHLARPPLEALVRRIVVLGGAGLFGRKLMEQLRHWGHAPLAASRRPGLDLRIDAEDSASLHSALRPNDLVLDAAGPYQHRSMRLIEAAMEIGCDVIDLNDHLGYAEKVLELSPTIESAGRTVCSSASSVSAVSAAVLRVSGLERPVRLCAFLAPASRHTANLGTAKSLLESLNRPIRVLREGQLHECGGWSEPRRFAMPQPVGTIRGRLFESADSVYLPAAHPSLREVAMYVDTNTFGLNGLLQLAARSAIVRRVFTLALRPGVHLAKWLGSKAGGIGYEIEDVSGRVERYFLCSAEQGYWVAVAPALLAARRILADTMPRRGMSLPHEQVEPRELFGFLEGSGIVLEAETAPPAGLSG